MHQFGLVSAVFFLIFALKISDVGSNKIVFRDSYELISVKTTMPPPIRRKVQIPNDHQNEINKIDEPANALEKRLLMKEKRTGVFSFQYEDMDCSYSSPYSQKKTALLVCNGTSCRLNFKKAWICGREDASEISCSIEMSTQTATCLELPGVRNIFSVPTIRPICPNGQDVAHDGSCRPPFE